MSRPLFSFYGSKYRLTPLYPEPRGTVVEMFAGSACYSLRNEVEHAILCDADPAISSTWRYLIGASRADILALPLLPNAGDRVDTLDLPIGARNLIGWWMNTGNVKPSLFRTPTAVKNMVSGYWGEPIRQRIADAVDKLRGWEMLDDWTEAPDLSDATYFVDPPYTTGGNLYKVNEFDRESVAKRLISLADNGARIIVCESPDATWLPFMPFADTKGHRKFSKEAVYTRG